MDTAVKPVKNGRGRRRRRTAEQKVMVLQEWQAGIPLEEVCRKYTVNAAQLSRWKCSLDQGLKEPGELVPKNHGLGLQKLVDELERALGRKALETDVLKKPSGRGWSVRRPWQPEPPCSLSGLDHSLKRYHHP